MQDCVDGFEASEDHGLTGFCDGKVSWPAQCFFQPTRKKNGKIKKGI